MSDEAAFLEALKANPADDTVRLVYADWLDERGRHMAAEYLRLTAALAHAEKDYPREQPEVERLLSLAEQLNAEWRTKAGSRFKAVLIARRKRTGDWMLELHLRSYHMQALWAFNGTPTELLGCVPFEQAFHERELFLQAGGEVLVLPFERPVPVPLTKPASE